MNNFFTLNALNNPTNRVDQAKPEDYKGTMTRGRAVSILTDAANKYEITKDRNIWDRMDLIGAAITGPVFLALIVATIALAILFPPPAFLFGIGALCTFAVLAGIACLITHEIVQTREVEKIEDIASKLGLIGQPTDKLSVQDMQQLTKQIRQESIRTELWNEFNLKAMNGVPPCFRCPLTNGIMQDPVVAADGKSYERSALEAELKRNPSFQNIRNMMIPNRALREVIEAYIGGTHRNGEPTYFECPISLELMKEPVIDSYGNSYERDQILEWLKHHSIEPFTTSRPLAPAQLVPNLALKEAIRLWRPKS